MAKKKATKEPSIEDSMAELQEIVQSLESGQEPLDESLAQFERGMKLLRSCHAQLENAAARIEVLTRIDADGNVETKPFASKATIEQTSSDDSATDEESTLF